MESQKHQELCKKVFRRIVPAELKEASIYAQSLSLPEYHAPQPINGFIPDILIYKNNSSEIIIGEAKTESDIDNKHTINQFEAFLLHSVLFKRFVIYYEVESILTSQLRHLFFKAKLNRNLRHMKNVLINGEAF